ncbi:MAG: hypothetical protein AB7O49_03870 [Sphingomonadales bacterium]
MLNQDISIIDGRIDPDWMEQFESHRFDPAEAQAFITETLPTMADLLGGGAYLEALPPHDKSTRTMVVITPPPQKSFRHVLTVIRQDLWLSKAFVGPDDESRWTFVV